MAGRFTSAEASQTTAILNAIYDIATTKAGVTFAGAKKWVMPKGAELDAAGFPYFVVMRPRSVGGAIGGQLQGGEIPILSGSYEPAWEFDCYALYPFSDAGDPLTYSTPEDTKVKLLQAFAIYYSLEQTCGVAHVIRPDVVDVQFLTGENYVAAKLTIRAYEQLNIDNTPA